MSKTEGQYHILHPLQKRIILSLAHKGPQTINETSKKVGNNQYKATYIAFQSLKGKGLIKSVDVKKYLTREYPKFWLTDEGLALAIIHKANIEILREHVEKLYGTQMKYNLLFDVAKALPPDKLGELLTMFKTTEEGNPKLKAIPISNIESQAVFRVLMKYPEIRKAIKAKLKGFVETL